MNYSDKRGLPADVTQEILSSSLNEKALAAAFSALGICPSDAMTFVQIYASAYDWDVNGRLITLPNVDLQGFQKL
jgi:hypothetical protein